MIVRAVDDCLRLITQPDHAHLAGRIMARSVALADHPRRAAILLAVAEHDNGWAEEDAAPTVNRDSGAVVDFVSAPLSIRHGVWPRGVARLASHPWAAALVAEHAITVYERFRADREWTPFFEAMEAARDRFLGESPLAIEDLAADYTFVRLGDLISLTFCTGWRDPQGFGPWTVELAGTRVSVAADPFGGATIPMAIAGREIPNRRFRSDADLRDALGAATRATWRGEVTGKALKIRPVPPS